MEKNFDFKQVPYGWALCFLDACDRKAECMRYQAYRHMPVDRLCNNCVLPMALQRPQCPLFHPVQKIHVAIGFRKIFDKVLAKDIADMRAELRFYLGCKTTYYKYWKGEKPLTPSQQQWIRELFRRYGYTHEIAFDGMEEVYSFESPSAS